jgi:hypothetical protein
MSVQFAAAQKPEEQTLLRQSVIAAQRAPFLHAPQIVPPQSTSVSSPSMIPSMHEAQIPATQRPFRQSVATPHCLPSEHW